MKKNHSLTHKAASLLILPLLHIFLLTACGGLATLLEFSTGRGVIYTVLAILAMLLFFLFPWSVILTDIASVSLSICALKHGESKMKNIATIVVSVFMIASIILLLIRFIPRLLEGMASV